MTDLTPQAIGLLTAVVYATSIIWARKGLQYSNPITITVTSVALQSVILPGIALTVTGIPPVGPMFLTVAVLVGFLMPIVRLLSYTGIAKVGAARGASLRSTHPLFSALIALTIFGESATPWVLTGVVLIVLGITLITWQPEKPHARMHWWDALYSVTAAILAAVVHNLTRFSLQSNSYPIFFAAIVGVVSLATIIGYLMLFTTPERPSWHRRALGPFLVTAFLENLGFLTFTVALTIGSVVLVTPMVATQPMWVLLFAVVSLRNIDLIQPRTVAGSCAVVAGTVAITLGGT